MRILRILLLTMALLSTATNVWADGVNYVMKITLSDGTVDKYFVYDRPKVFLTGDSVHVWTKVLSTSYSADAVVCYTFEETATGIGEVSDDEDADGITFEYLDGETVIVGGLSADDTIKVFSLTGSEAGALIDRYDAGADISLRNLSSGTYIISINNSKSIKVLKR